MCWMQFKPSLGETHKMVS